MSSRVTMPVIADVRPGNTRYFVDNRELALTAAAVPVPTVEGSLVISDATLKYIELLHPLSAHQHLETGATTAAWQANVTLANDAFLHFGPAPGASFEYDAANAHLQITGAPVHIAQNVGIGTQPAAVLEVNAATAADVGLIVQTTDDDTTKNLTEWQDSAGTVLSSFTGDGRLNIDGQTDAVQLTVQAMPNALGIQSSNIVEILDRFNQDVVSIGASGRTLISSAGSASHGSPLQFMEVRTSFSGSLRSDFVLSNVGTANGTGQGFVFRMRNITDASDIFALVRAQAYDTTARDSLMQFGIMNAGGTIIALQLHPDDGVTIDNLPSTTVHFTVKGAAVQTASLLQLKKLDGSVFFDSGHGRTGSELVVNQQGEDIDSRFESVNQTHMLFVDAANDVVGIRSSTPATLADGLHVPWTTGDAQTTAYFGSVNINNDQNAVTGVSFSANGVIGITDAGAAAGVRGEGGTLGTGVHGISTANVGVFGVSSTSWGVGAESATGVAFVANLTGVGTIADFQDNGASILTIQDGGQADFAEYLRHLGDTDTFWRFQANQASLDCGGVTTIDALSTYVRFGVNVGVGAVPAVNLDIAASAPIARLTDTRTLSAPNWDNTTIADLDFYTSDGSGGGMGVIGKIRSIGAVDSGNDPFGELAIWTGPTSAFAERVRVTYDGKVGIGTTAPATSALLDLTSTTGALLVSRMTTGQRNALTAVNGMIIYNSSTGAFNFYEAGAWVTGSGLA